MRVIARQVRDKNCLAATFAPRHQSVSSGPLGWGRREGGTPGAGRKSREQCTTQKRVWDAPGGGDNFHFAKCSRPFIQSVKSTLSSLCQVLQTLYSRCQKHPFLPSELQPRRGHPVKHRLTLSGTGFHPNKLLVGTLRPSHLVSVKQHTGLTKPNWFPEGMSLCGLLASDFVSPPNLFRGDGRGVKMGERDKVVEVKNSLAWNGDTY